MLKHKFSYYRSSKRGMIIRLNIKAEIMMLFHWSLRTRFHCCCEWSVKFTSVLRNVSLLRIFKLNEALSNTSFNYLFHWKFCTVVVITSYHTSWIFDLCMLIFKTSSDNSSPTVDAFTEFITLLLRLWSYHYSVLPHTGKLNVNNVLKSTLLWHIFSYSQ